MAKQLVVIKTLNGYVAMDVNRISTVLQRNDGLLEVSLGDERYIIDGVSMEMFCKVLSIRLKSVRIND